MPTVIISLQTTAPVSLALPVILGNSLRAAVTDGSPESVAPVEQNALLESISPVNAVEQAARMILFALIVGIVRLGNM